MHGRVPVESAADEASKSAVRFVVPTLECVFVKSVAGVTILFILGYPGGILGYPGVIQGYPGVSRGYLGVSGG